MQFLLMHLSNVVVPAALTAAQNDTAPGAFISDKIGFIVLGIIVGPVFLLTVASMIQSKSIRIPALFVSAFVIFVSAVIVGLAAIGFALKFVIPQ